MIWKVELVDGAWRPIENGRTKLVLDEVDRCGIWPFVLPLYHPFTPACAKHDERYVSQALDRLSVDKLFLAEMRAITNYHNGLAREQLERESLFYYKVARVLGAVPWNLRKMRKWLK